MGDVESEQLKLPYVLRFDVSESSCNITRDTPSKSKRVHCWLNGLTSDHVQILLADHMTI